eukprot:2112458-Lingulodinium_polyedra.AAC.1
MVIAWSCRGHFMVIHGQCMVIAWSFHGREHGLFMVMTMVISSSWHGHCMVSSWSVHGQFM